MSGPLCTSGGTVGLGGGGYIVRGTYWGYLFSWGASARRLGRVPNAHRRWRPAEVLAVAALRTTEDPYIRERRLCEVWGMRFMRNTRESCAQATPYRGLLYASRRASYPKPPNSRPGTFQSYPLAFLRSGGYRPLSPSPPRDRRSMALPGPCRIGQTVIPSYTRWLLPSRTLQKASLRQYANKCPTGRVLLAQVFLGYGYRRPNVLLRPVLCRAAGVPGAALQGPQTRSQAGRRCGGIVGVG
jgi:hypothetical protein